MKRFYFILLILFAQVAWGQIPTNGLVAYYPFNGNVNDESGNTVNGTNNGGTFTNDRYGNASKAIQFNGNSWVDIGTTLQNNLFTINLWIYVTSLPSNNYGLISKLDNLNSTNRFKNHEIYLQSNGKINAIIADGTIWNNFNSLSRIKANEWTMLTLRYSGSTASLFINGGLDASYSISDYTISNVKTVFGRRAVPFNSSDNIYLNGRLDDIRFYNRALSDAEIQQIYFAETNITCPTCITGQTQTNFSTLNHYCAAQSLCSQTIINKAQTDPKQKIIRGDLAKISYLGLVGRTPITNAQNFDNPFIDLQKTYSTDTTYYKFAKVLSYLEYQDGRSPFDRNRINFSPNDTITRASVLKVMLEAWNIDETTAAAGASPFTDVTTAHPYYKYIKKAYDLGIVTGSGGLFKPDLGCSREDAFLMLYRILTSASITKPTLTQINAGFFVPNTFRPDNLGVGIGTDRANFNHYTKTSFAIDGTVPLVFAHSYNSYATELPNELFPNFLGRGWTHSFNCYVVAYGLTTDPNRRRIVHYPDGTLHYYKQLSNGTWTPEEIGVFDTMVEGIGFLEITTPSQVVYRFETQAGKAGNYLLIKSIKDRNNNILTFTNELGIDNYPRLKSVADPAGRTLNFVYNALNNWLIEVNLSGVNTFNGRKVTFDYNTLPLDGDGVPDLKEYKEPDLTGILKTTTYGYFAYTDSTAHLLKTIALPKGNIIDNTYQQRKLTSSRTMNGTAVVQKMDVNLTQSYTSTSSSTSSVVKTTDENGLQKTTNYQHNGNGLPTQVTTTGSQPLIIS